MTKTILRFGLLIVALFCLMAISKYWWVSGDLSVEIIIGILALLFFWIGVWISKQQAIKPQIPLPDFDIQKANELGLTPRELDVLDAMALGASNKEIGEQLFVSESTIKTHVSNILLKLGAKRRTQAIRLARQWQLLKKL
jgi:DNA-binding CsgD family transcriptional regulator